MNNLDIMRFIVGKFTSFSPGIEFLPSLFLYTVYSENIVVHIYFEIQQLL